MGFFKRILGIEPNLKKLMSATIVSNMNHDYFVTFTKYEPQTPVPEFVRLMLHYYAKILFNFDPEDAGMAQSAMMLRRMMDLVISAGIQKNTKTLHTAIIYDVAKIVASRPPDDSIQIVATLFQVSATRRHITTDIPQNIYVQHMFFSVIILLHSILIELDDDCIEILNRALKNMHSAYDAGQSFSEPQNLESIPTNAYMSALLEKFS